VTGLQHHQLTRTVGWESGSPVDGAPSLPALSALQRERRALHTTVRSTVSLIKRGSVAGSLSGSVAFERVWSGGSTASVGMMRGGGRRCVWLMNATRSAPAARG
jgi:hypothetical protein